MPNSITINGTRQDTSNMTHVEYACVASSNFNVLQGSTVANFALHSQNAEIGVHSWPRQNLMMQPHTYLDYRDQPPCCSATSSDRLPLHAHKRECTSTTHSPTTPSKVGKLAGTCCTRVFWTWESRKHQTPRTFHFCTFSPFTSTKQHTFASYN